MDGYNSNKQLLKEALSEILKPHDEVVVIHSSIPDLNLTTPALKWDLLSSLKSLINQGRTLLLPTFSFSFCKTQRYHQFETRPETGILGEWFLTLNNVSRSYHPIYSFAIGGKLQKYFLNCQCKTTFGSSSIFAELEKFNTRIVMMGADWSSCTQIHRYEEEALVPYRKFKKFSGDAYYSNDWVQVEETFYVRDENINPENNLAPLFDRLKKQNKVLSSEKNTKLQSVDLKDLSELTRLFLKKDPFSLTHNPRVIENKTKSVNLDSKDKVKVALLSNSNQQILKTEMAKYIRSNPHFEIEIYCPSFGQTIQEISITNSELYNFSAHYTFFTDRLEDLFQIPSLDVEMEFATANLEIFVNDYVERIINYSRRSGSLIFINSFAVEVSPIWKNADINTLNGVEHLIGRANGLVQSRLSQLPNIFLFSLHQAIANFKLGAIRDERLWFLARIPYSQNFSEFMASEYCNLILSLKGNSIRLLVLDLDNTLWGGILGEDGSDGVQLGGDYPGNCFAYWQKTLKECRKNGILLAIASKNDEELVWNHLDNNPNMILKKSDFSSWKINWDLKYENVKTISSELGIGLENILFIDDNPAEREQMKLNLPAVHVLDLPSDVAEYSQKLKDFYLLDKHQISSEDRSRADNYLKRTEILSTQSNFSSPDQFYQSLGGAVYLSSINEHNFSRAHQLINKTNQFNTTNKRYSSADLKSILENKNYIIKAIAYSDKWSRKEIIGLIILNIPRDTGKKIVIDSLLLSCRVIGRGIEQALFSWITTQADIHECNSIVGDIIPTERNIPTRDLYKNFGFKKCLDSYTWELAPLIKQADCPQWIQLVVEGQFIKNEKQRL